MKFSKSIFASLVILGLASIALAQNTVVTKNADGTYSVIEYPVGKEITVNLLPSGTFTGKGKARVVRSANGTKVVFDVNGLPATTSNYYAYAVDPSGATTLLGPLTVTNGVATAEFSTPLDRFMLALSPTDNLTGITSSNVVLTSEVPSGFTVIPRTGLATTASGVAASTAVRYEVPMLNVTSFGKNEKTAFIKFTDGEFAGVEAKAHIHRHDNMTNVRVVFNDLKRIPTAKRFVVWTYSPDGKYTRLGQVFNYKNRDEATIQGDTDLTDFGLLMTVEDADVTAPTSTVWSVFKVS